MTVYERSIIKHPNRSSDFHYIVEHPVFVALLTSTQLNEIRSMHMFFLNNAILYVVI